MTQTFEEYIAAYNVVETEKDENKYLSFNTDFENLTIFFNPTNLFHSIAPVIRFINTEYYDFYESNDLQGAYFLPSHIEDKLNDCFEHDTIDNYCNPYLPVDMQIAGLDMTKTKSLVYNSGKNHCGTSLFVYSNINEQGIQSLIKELKENIPALKDFDVALGNVPIDYGIIEQSNTVKTKDPESRHCSFWKFENVKNFNELAKNFTKIEYKVETC